MKNKIIGLVLASLVVSVGIGQDLKPITLVPSPNAAALGLYDKIPVNHFSGMPNISIPIHDIVYRDIKVPISLNYHAAAIKPDQPVGWVGLGWSLMSGGVITREMRGRYDESVTPKGFLLSYNALNVSDWNTQQKLWDYSQSMDDVFPDIFRFSMNGYSGEIVFSHTGTWEVISDQNIKVVFSRPCWCCV